MPFRNFEKNVGTIGHNSSQLSFFGKSKISIQTDTTLDSNTNQIKANTFFSFVLKSDIRYLSGEHVPFILFHFLAYLPLPLWSMSCCCYSPIHYPAHVAQMIFSSPFVLQLHHCRPQSIVDSEPMSANDP